jgi:hypothetical protein
VTHKILHGLTGALANIHKGEKAMISGAAGGALAEVFAEGFVDSKNVFDDIRKEHPNDQQKWLDLAKDRIDMQAFICKLSTAFSVGLCGGDVQVSYDAADRSIENNFKTLAFKVLFAAYIGATAHTLYEAHEHGGWDEVLRVGKMEAELVAITEATAAELGGLPAAVAAGGTYMAYRIGGKVYLTAPKAWAALCKLNPELQKSGLEKSFLKYAEGKGVPHGNSKQFMSDTHAYVIRDAEGNLHKVGESMQGVNKFGLSKRAEQQVRKLQKETGQQFESEIRHWFPSKKEAREYETWLIQSLRERYGKEMLPGNKGVH